MQCGRAVIAAASILAAAAMPATAKTYPDPAAPSVALEAWQAGPGVRLLETDFGKQRLRIPLQAVTSVQTRTGVGASPDRVVALWVEATLPELRTIGADTVEHFRRRANPDVLWLRLYADVRPGMMQHFEKTIAQSVQGGLYREVTDGGWQGLTLYALADKRTPPLMEGFFEAAAHRRYVECRLAGVTPGCSATYQRDDGLTVEYSFGLGWLDRMGWLDDQVAKLVSGFVVEPQEAATR